MRMNVLALIAMFLPCAGTVQAQKGAIYKIHSTAQTKTVVIDGGVRFMGDFSDGRSLIQDKNGWFVIDSATNFVFAKKEGLAGKDVYESVKKQGILIRHFATPGIEDFVRITIGTPEQMEQLKKIMEVL